MEKLNLNLIPESKGNDKQAWIICPHTLQEIQEQLDLHNQVYTTEDIESFLLVLRDLEYVIIQEAK